MTISRQIGWGTEANLLYSISRQLDRAISILSCCTTTSTTTIAPTTTTTTTTQEDITTTTTTTVEPFFMMKFDSLDNADLMIGGDSADVADWNTFFGLPGNGLEFNNIAIDGVLKTVTLYGGGNMTLSDNLFGDNEPTGTSLLEVEDNGVTIECGYGLFGDYNIGNGCYGLSKCYLPSCITLGDYVFGDCEVLADLDLPFDSYTILGEGIFEFCFLLPQYNFNNLTIAGAQLFRGLSQWTNPTFPSLTTAGFLCFDFSINLDIISFPVLTSVGPTCFYRCTGLTSLGLPVCTDLGGTTGDDNVFAGITGKTITITIPHALETDGDIVWLKANNSVTVLYSD